MTPSKPDQRHRRQKRRGFGPAFPLHHTQRNCKPPSRHVPIYSGLSRNSLPGYYVLVQQATSSRRFRRSFHTGAGGTLRSSAAGCGISDCPQHLFGTPWVHTLKTGMHRSMAVAQRVRTLPERGISGGSVRLIPARAPAHGWRPHRRRSSGRPGYLRRGCPAGFP